MDGIDREILRLTQDGIGIEERPFLHAARTLGISEEEVVGRLERLRDAGVIRRFGTRINPRKAGFAANAMVVWSVPRDRAAAIGTAMAESPDVTHCYERRTVPGRWEYNLYTVLHCRDREAVLRKVGALSRATGAADYRIIISTEEFKRQPSGRIEPATGPGRGQ
ncbi:Lrp/AsnC family transcriptional regulator [Methanoculleus sp. FWC-SCC1]|uniref:siroheme decarboxylase n=1 Tax=Methanoculleus frigidifontis TaxID=2584085 RepID=A0ABT8M797_9EURY|nr:siroheme decarboxylase subunit beta [Methanoculleus sp. FWC-SCC1]MDN7023796.1 Lrp/AsnC family transcriptional regulator [Methanoculleus sp. FWC-SCC1]